MSQFTDFERWLMLLVGCLVLGLVERLIGGGHHDPLGQSALVAGAPSAHPHMQDTHEELTCQAEESNGR